MTASPVEIGQAGILLLDAVAPLVAEGFAVHRLRARSKAPVEDAWSTAPVYTLAQLRAAWREDDNAGVRLGALSKVGAHYLHAIDMDVRDPARVAEARAALAKFIPEFDTLPYVISGSGGESRHFYFLTEKPFRSKKLRHSAEKVTDKDGKQHWAFELELFGTGKQVALPPSIHPDTELAYTWGREIDFLDLLISVGPFISETRVEKWAPESIPLGEDDDEFTAVVRARPMDLTEKQVDDILAALPLDAYCDDRDGWLRVGAALHHQYEGRPDGLTKWMTFSKQCPKKYDEKDLIRVWKSFGGARRPTTMATLIKAGNLARAATATLANDNYGDDVDLNTDGLPLASRLSFLSPAECAAAPARGYVIKGILAPGDVGCIFGPPGAGKSLLAPHLGYMVAQGALAFGMRTLRGGVFYVAAEDSLGMRGRIQALQLAHGDAPDFLLVDGVSDLLINGSPDLVALLAAVDERRPALIILDTLAMSFPGLEENSAEGMGRVMAVARSLAASGPAVLLIHHDTKAEGSTPRGHSLLNGALDMALRLHGRDEQGVVRGRLTKNRNGDCDRDIAFRIETRELRIDEDGDPITAALVSELAQGSAPRRRKLPPSESAALKILEHLSGTNGLVIEEDWRAACMDGRTVSASDERDHRRRVFARAFQGLAQKGIVLVRDDFVSRAGELTSSGYNDDGFDEG